ncbi:Tyrosine-protein kinase isoform SRK1 [Holothuria leucospilota]|uniref:Tyrosine-protein kinase isoform SRK1 n=1 Tax=Holothuria leucospilota TaxID=206669 RepID=A0A9Q1CD00_HOLLE|nr:Tyrosine-protein kinase isoform SRK1 [Holothuria leucospilota]
MEVFAAYLSGYHVFLWSCFFICGFLFEISLTNELFTHTVTQSGTVILDCSTPITLESTWTFDNNDINLNRVIWDKRFKQNSFITANYSLLIQNVSIEQEGLYQCTNGSQILSSHSIKVEVIPTVYLTVNGVHKEDQYVIIPRNETVIATCVASSARPPVNITWFVNKTKVNSSSIDHQVIATNNQSNDTFDTSSSIRFQPDGESGNITCVIDGLSEKELLAQVKFKVEIIPTVYLTVNGVHKEDQYVIIPRNETVIATCVASSARPPVNITWFINKTKVNSSSIDHQVIATNNQSNDTFDTSSSIRFQPDGESGNITCVIDGLSEKELFSQVKFKVENDRRTKNDTKISSTLRPSTSAIPLNITVIIIVMLSAAIILICLVAVACIVKKVKGSSQPHGQTNQTTPLDSPCVDTAENERVSVHLPKGCADYARTLEPELTNIRDENSTNDPDYSFLPEFEGDLEMQYMTPKSRNFSAKEMSLLVKMKTGPVYTRWMGTVSIDSENTKSVVISTITDRTLRTKEIHWQEYVKRVLDLPRNKNLVSVVGICMDAVSLYLLNEHIVGETLDKRILATNTVNCNKMNLMAPIEALLYVRGILEGMELVHSYGFLHPGLTTRKILVTDEGVCKLYDFCLSMDADKRVAIAKAQTMCNLNQFAPEALLRNIYTQECDVWSVGVVIWEIFSGGSHPFPSTEESISSLNALPSPPNEWPRRYGTLRNRRVFDCWEEEVSLRPSLNQLRLSFSKISNSLKSCGDRETVPTQNGPLALEEFGYTTMVGNTYD